MQIDPDYQQARPIQNAIGLLNMFGASRMYLRVLDFGGGNGLMTHLLTAYGFLVSTTYDPFTPSFATLPRDAYDIVCCIETLEHVTDPAATITDIIARLAPGGLVLLSTLLQPDDIEQQGLNWWYVAPRNGHISLFSRQALNLVWTKLGFTLEASRQVFTMRIVRFRCSRAVCCRL